MGHLLEVRNLVTKFYTDDGVVHAVNGISYNLSEGETLGIVGESGSGKTVGVKSVTQLLPMPPAKIESGEILYKGLNLLGLSQSALRRVRGKELAMIFQDPMTSLTPVLSIETQMTEGLELHLGLSHTAAVKRAIEYLNLVGIPDAQSRLKNYPHQFSGGQRQRIMIAMALSMEPSILIADEPTTALDVTIQAQITELVTELKEKIGMAVIWITHDLGVVAGLVDKVLVMYGGFVVEYAPVVDLYTKTSHPYTLGLLQSLPSVDGSNERLIPIAGSPPDLSIKPHHCPFAPRCRFAIERCWDEIPTPEEIAPEHIVACFRWEAVRGGVDS